MAMDVSTPDHSDDAALNTTINTTPLVDVMLVLLIIFLITIPVVLKVVPVNLPNAKNIATQSKPQNIILAVTKDGSTYVNNVRFDDNNAVIAELEKHSRDKPQPEVHIRGDKDARFQDIGKLVYDCQRAGIEKVGFILEPHNGPSE